MTPQPRHFDTARDIIDKYHDFRHPLQVEDMARALAEAENRAAWDGWDTRHRWSNESFQERWHKIEDDFAAKYGPRPAKENPHA